MQEFMLFIKTQGDHLEGLSPEQQQEHVRKVGNYIGGLVDAGKLKGAQPLQMNGTIIRGTNGTFKDGPFNESKEVIVGYFHILAADLEEAISIGKANPIFDDTDCAIEVRPIKQVEGIN